MKIVYNINKKVYEMDDELFNALLLNEKFRKNQNSIIFKLRGQEYERKRQTKRP